MFKEATVFILGAGASWHYGYPTGEDLVDYVGAMALKFEAYCRNRLNSHQFSHQIPKYVGSKLDRSKGSSGAAEAWQATADECRALIERIESVRPLVIDYFLAWNEDLKDIGNLMIAAVILECEGFWNTFRRNRNDPKAPVRSHDWYRFIIHNIVYRCGTSKDLFENQVHFVTFNYDTSLETRLFSALSAIKMFSPNDIDQFLYDQRVVHVYGSVNTGARAGSYLADNELAVALGELGQVIPSTEEETAHVQAVQSRKNALDKCRSACGDLLTIDPHSKTKNEERLETAKQWINDAASIVILGYGFDENNNDRLDLPRSLYYDEKNHNLKRVMFTNYEDRLRVNKSASRLALRRPNAFATHAPETGGSRTYEKSTRNVYDALALDFDL